ncbi:MAG: tRNA (adenosine(37)-N6)-threonylcarbamoyltransferase complex dimerization subunit type 1 TsaB [Endomicrobium sp.]|jgi:tRNA threonylcarbamoyl adenosine modification protein YeaZ|nr:tRNA (adenosine(37)-N6)-threonylcarbamoyltransferase complex dimerization subunit type 1 TsaB [Endomicrobium sp.]
MTILAIETSGSTFSIALNIDGTVVIHFFYSYAQHIHSEIIIPTIKQLLKQAGYNIKNIDKFAISIGPGSFTGIRIGITIFRLFAQVLNKKIIPVDTLSILESSLNLKTKNIKIVPAIVASKEEIYIRNNNNLTNKFCIELKNINEFIAELKKYKRKILIIGNAAILYKKQFCEALGKFSVSLPYIMHIPSAYYLSLIAYNASDSQYIDYNNILPFYVKTVFK